MAEPIAAECRVLVMACDIVAVGTVTAGDATRIVVFNHHGVHLKPGEYALRAEVELLAVTAQQFDAAAHVSS